MAVNSLARRSGRLRYERNHRLDQLIEYDGPEHEVPTEARGPERWRASVMAME